MAMTCVLASGFFALDLWLPRGMAEGELYAALVVLAFWSAPPRFLLLVTSGMSLFIVSGFFWAPGPPSWVTLTNRGLGLVIMWVIALLLLHRKRTQEELEQGSLKLSSVVTELTKRSQELTLLNEMATQLQGCATSEAAYAVITTYARQLLPGNSGALGIKRPAHNYIEIVQEWGESGINKPVFALEECCALRHNEPYAVGRMHKSARFRLAAALVVASALLAWADACSQKRGEAAGASATGQPAAAAVSPLAAVQAREQAQKDAEYPLHGLVTARSSRCGRSPSRSR